MDASSEPAPFRAEPAAVAAVLVGVVIMAVPFLLLPLPEHPGGGGPINFAVLMMYGILGTLGLLVAALGVYAAHTGNAHPAVTAVTTVSGWAILGGIGWVIETSGGPLIPIWAWVLAVVGVSLIGHLVANRTVGRT